MKWTPGEPHKYGTDVNIWWSGFVAMKKEVQIMLEIFLGLENEIKPAFFTVLVKDVNK